MFEGAYTALVTPFTANGDVDFEKLKALVERQIDGGVDGLVPVGTTGESPTLNVEEHLQVIRTTVETAKGRALVIAGTGANSTSEAIEITKAAAEFGIDGTLQVTPYYNKPNQEGLIRHFSAVAEIGVPVVLYNVPGRSAREIAIDTVVELSKHPNIVALKEAGGSVDRVSQVKRRCEIEVLSGDDALTFPMMAVGAVGVISVASNVAPKLVANLVHAVLAGQWLDAAELHQNCHRLFCDMFLDTNPIPVKAAMAMMGLIEEVYRLPLCPLQAGLKDKLADCLRAYDLL
ncbi:MAG: 4-hydroxy-tetrahydrodipicolinate synthase [Spartobacteria bacterium]|nr:4-hydroxy-tetrahydrodipicolinate synthase [Spartobacteria bacterium]